MRNLLSALFKLTRGVKKPRKTIKDYQQEILLKQGRDQFKKLMKLGHIPVVLL